MTARSLQNSRNQLTPQHKMAIMEKAVALGELWVREKAITERLRVEGELFIWALANLAHRFHLRCGTYSLTVNRLHNEGERHDRLCPSGDQENSVVPV